MLTRSCTTVLLALALLAAPTVAQEIDLSSSTGEDRRLDLRTCARPAPDPRPPPSQVMLSVLPNYGPPPMIWYHHAFDLVGCTPDG